MEHDELRKEKRGEQSIPVGKIVREELNFYDN